MQACVVSGASKANNEKGPLSVHLKVGPGQTGSLLSAFAGRLFLAGRPRLWLTPCFVSQSQSLSLSAFAAPQLSGWTSLSASLELVWGVASHLPSTRAKASNQSEPPRSCLLSAARFFGQVIDRPWQWWLSAVHQIFRRLDSAGGRFWIFRALLHARLWLKSNFAARTPFRHPEIPSSRTSTSQPPLTRLDRNHQCPSKHPLAPRPAPAFSSLEVPLNIFSTD